MAPPLTSDGQVTYADGTKATVDQLAKDVAAFLTWTAEPKLESRHRAGLAVLLFLIVATGSAYMSYRNIWAAPHYALSISPKGAPWQNQRYEDSRGGNGGASTEMSSRTT